MYLFALVPVSVDELSSKRRLLSAERKVAIEALSQKKKEFLDLREKSRGAQLPELETLARDIIRLRAVIEACEDAIIELDGVRKLLEFEEAALSQPAGAS